MSVPLLLFMVAANDSAIIASYEWYIVLPVVLVLGFIVTHAILRQGQDRPGLLRRNGASA